jgi:D-glycero-alpha-D-manno-heptose-7-phosphate kinase
MNIRSRAPLRISFAGGGTDLSVYSNTYGGAVFNATISMYSYCTITPTNDNKIVFLASDRNEYFAMDAVPHIPVSNPLILHKGVYNRIVKDFNGGKPLSFSINTSSDAPSGSGLGTSSTMVVTILEAFNKWLGLGLSDYKKAHLAYDIERNDLGLKGGKQDQYCAVFGGFNLMEFKEDGSVVINPLRIEKTLISELECSLILYFNGYSRNSGEIISQQIKNTLKRDEASLTAMHTLKKNAYLLKDAILTRDLVTFAALMRGGWENKKKTSGIISNPEVEKTINYLSKHGAEAVKVSGAGGGGFIMVLCNPINRQCLFEAINALKIGSSFPVRFSESGVESWII